MQHKSETIANTREVIDGNQYSECRFENCQMVYCGGEIPTISSCHFENCKWQFEDAAERTLIFMKSLYHGMGPGGVELIEATLSAIRQSGGKFGT
jgi:hypothetical protein